MRRLIYGARLMVACAATGALLATGAAGAAGAQPRPAVFVLGGPAAVGEAVAGELAHLLGTGVDRLAGADRYGTAAAASRARFPAAQRVIVASGETFADAVSAGPAAARLRAPILLVARDAIPPATAAELDRLRPGHVVIAGGPVAVSPRVEAALAAEGRKVERAAGPDRAATSAALARLAAPGTGGTVFVASGRGHADALSAAAPAAVRHAPILLVDPDGVGGAVRAELARLRPSRVVLVGGESAVPRAIEARLRELTGAPLRRLAGPDRYATGALVSAAFYPGGADAVYVANGGGFADAMVVGALATAAPSGSALQRHAPWRGVLLYTARDEVPDAVRRELARLARASRDAPPPESDDALEEPPEREDAPPPAEPPAEPPAGSAPPGSSPPPGTGGGGGGTAGPPPNAAPTLDLNGGRDGEDATATFTEDGAAAPIAPEAVVADADGATLSGATITLTDRPDGAAESLAATATLPDGIAASAYDAATGVLALSGAAPLADYQAALRLIAYRNDSQGPAAEARAVTVAVNDGTDSSLARTSIVTVVGVNDPPIAADDTYGDEQVFGNVLFVSTAGAETGALAAARTTHTLELLDNDTDPDGDALSVTGIAVTTGEGTATILNAATGAYSYEPHVAGTHVLTYTISDGAETAQATVTIDVEHRVWFVDHSGGAGTGRSTATAADLATVAAADAPGDIVFVLAGTGGTLTGGIQLEEDAQLLGQPNGLTLTHSQGGAATLVAAGGDTPIIGNPGGTAVTLASGATVKHVRVSGAATGIAGTSAASPVTLQHVAVDGVTSGVALSGGTYQLTGGVTIASGAGAALEQTGGTLTVKGSGNTLSAAGGEALHVSATTVSGGLTFQSITATGGARAVTFSPSNEAATLAVTGLTGAGSGGTIQGATGDAITISAGTVTLSRMLLRDNHARAIVATGSHGLTLSTMELRDNGDAAGEHTVALTDLSGPVLIVNSAFRDAAGDLLHVAGTDVSASLAITGSTFEDGDASGGAAGVAIAAEGSSALTASVTGSTFRDLAAAGLSWRAGQAAGASGTSSLSVDGSTFTSTDGSGRHSGMAVDVGEATTTALSVGTSTPNTFQRAGASGAGAIDLHATGGATLLGTIDGNTVADAPGAGIRQRTGSSATVRLRVTGNLVSSPSAEAVWLANAAGAGTATLDATIAGNQVTGAAATGAIVVEAFEHEVCADVESNTVSGTRDGAADVRLHADDPATPGSAIAYVAAGTGAAVTGDVSARNTLAGTVSLAGTVTRSGGAACDQP